MSETCRGHLWDKIIIKLFASSWYIFRNNTSLHRINTPYTAIRKGPWSTNFTRIIIYSPLKKALFYPYYFILLPYINLPYFPAHKTHFFFPEKCHLNLTCILCAEGKYYFQTYKYPYIYYTTSLSWDSENNHEDDFSGSDDDFLGF